MFRNMLLISVFCCVLSASLVAQTVPERCKQPKAMVDVINQYHYAPRPINDQFVHSTIVSMMQMLDPQALYFVKNDTSHILNLHEGLKEYIENKSCFFLDSIVQLYRTRLTEVDTLIGLIVANKIKFKG
jgi:carboxyl-terminal processing protease